MVSFTKARLLIYIIACLAGLCFSHYGVLYGISMLARAFGIVNHAHADGIKTFRTLDNVAVTELLVIYIAPMLLVAGIGLVAGRLLQAHGGFSGMVRALLLWAFYFGIAQLPVWLGMGAFHGSGFGTIHMSSELSATFMILAVLGMLFWLWFCFWRTPAQFIRLATSSEELRSEHINAFTNHALLVPYSVAAGLFFLFTLPSSVAIVVFLLTNLAWIVLLKYRIMNQSIAPKKSKGHTYNLRPVHLLVMVLLLAFIKLSMHYSWQGAARIRPAAFHVAAHH